MTTCYSLLLCTTFGSLLVGALCNPTYLILKWLFLGFTPTHSTAFVLSYAPHLMFFYLCAWVVTLWVISLKLS